MQPQPFAAIVALSLAVLSPVPARAIDTATPQHVSGSAPQWQLISSDASPMPVPSTATAPHRVGDTTMQWQQVARDDSTPLALQHDTTASLQKAVREVTMQQTAPPIRAAQPYTRIGGIPVPADDYAQGMIRTYLAQYTTSFGRQELYKTLDDAERYRLYVRRELQRRGMPAALEYLPVVESSYKPLATSRSGARGLWQFMENSIARLLHKDDWVDERLDPWLSTDAALRKLQDNYAMFHDWPLAIAAYNCGAGAMNTILKAAPQKSFWHIAENGLLRDQSVQYVPKLLAICELAEHGARYGVPLPVVSTTERFADFDYLSVSGQLWLDRLESELRMEAGTLHTLNPALLRGCTPPEREYRLRLPAGTRQAALMAIALICYGEHVRGATRRHRLHIVTKGETLYAISRRYGCTVEEIRAANAIDENALLSIGKTLYIPIKSAETK